MKGLRFLVRAAGVWIASLALFVAILLFLPLSLFLLWAGLAWVAGWALWEIVKGRASRHWPHTEGLILSSSMEQHSTQLVSGVSRAPLANRLEYQVPKVSYSYTVNGLKHVGHRALYCALGSDPRFDPETFAEGETVRVYYNPNTPRESVLVPGVPLFQLVLFVLVCLFCLFTTLGGLAVAIQML